MMDDMSPSSRGWTIETNTGREPGREERVTADGNIAGKRRYWRFWRSRRSSVRASDVARKSVEKTISKGQAELEMDNLHRVAVYYCLTPDARSRRFFVITSFALVLVQLCTLFGIIIVAFTSILISPGHANAECVMPVDCFTQFSCMEGLCIHCENDATFGYLEYKYKAYFVEDVRGRKSIGPDDQVPSFFFWGARYGKEPHRNGPRWLLVANFTCPEEDIHCRRCYSPPSRHFVISTDENLNSRKRTRGTLYWYMSRHVRNMGIFDFLAMYITSFIIGLSWADEAEDIELCSHYLEEKVKHAGLKTCRSSMNCCCRCFFSSRSAFQVRILQLVIFSRRFLLFPGLMYCIVTVILNLGADALSLTFNTVAVLLILDLDNLILVKGLPHTAYQQAAKEFRMELDEQRVSEAGSARYLHILGAAFAITSSIFNEHFYDFPPSYCCFSSTIGYQFCLGIANGGLGFQGLKRAMHDVFYQVVGLVLLACTAFSYVVLL